MTRALTTAGATALPALLDTLRGGYPAAHQLTVELLRCAFLPAAEEHQGGDDGADEVGSRIHQKDYSQSPYPSESYSSPSQRPEEAERSTWESLRRLKPHLTNPVGWGLMGSTRKDNNEGGPWGWRVRRWGC
jgi:hypothetical protein